MRRRSISQFRKRYRVVYSDGFDGAGSWILPTGVGISSGTINKTEAPGTLRTALIAANVQFGAQYRITETVGARTAGSARIDAGRIINGPGAGTARTSNGTYTESISAGLDGGIQVVFVSAANLGLTVDNLLVERV